MNYVRYLITVRKSDYQTYWMYSLGVINLRYFCMKERKEEWKEGRNELRNIALKKLESGI